MPEIQSRPLRPIAAVIAVVALDQKLLLVRRANPPDASYWGFPGGKINFGETMMAATVRELREETGISAVPENIITTLEVIDQADQIVRAHYLLIAVRCRYLGGVPIAADDALEARWFTLAEIRSSTMQLSRDVDRIASLALTV